MKISVLGSDETFGTFCPFFGKFQMIYQNVQHKLCHELKNCKGSNELQIQSYECQERNEVMKNYVGVEKLNCLGHWSSDFPGKYFGILKNKTHYKCIVSIS